MSQSVIDQLVSDYLDSKGLPEASAALKTANEGRSTRCDRIVSELLEMIDQMKFEQLRKRWILLSERLLNNVTLEQSILANEIEHDLYKLFLVRCIMKNEKHRCTTFFTAMATTLKSDPKWTEWFCIHYVPEPKEIDVFKKYFTKQWREVFAISLHNFFNLVLGARTQPLLCTLAERCAEGDAALAGQSPSSSFSGSPIELEAANGDFSPVMSSVDEELLDEFAVIAQCTGPLKSSTSKNSLKNMIKSIGGKRMSEERGKPS